MSHASHSIAVSLLAILAISIPALGGTPSAQDGEEMHALGRHMSDFATVHVSSVDELIAAVGAANSSRRPTRIEISPGLYAFPQVISTDFGSSSLPAITSTIILDGGDASATRFDNFTADVGARYLTVLKRGRLVVRNLTLANGTTTCQQDVNCSQVGGGAAENAGGELIFEDCVLTQNFTFEMEGNDIAFGGAIMNLSGRLTLERTQVINNEATGSGGGIAFMGGSGQISHSIVSGNAGAIGNTRGLNGLSEGGGLYVANAEVLIWKSTVAGNQAAVNFNFGSVAFGGGLFNEGTGKVWLLDSAVTENIARGAGAGGGILNNGRMHIENSTVGSNTAGTFGGGISNSGSLVLQGVTLARNFADSDTATQENGDVVFPGCGFACAGSGGGIWNDAAGNTRFARSVDALNSSSHGPDCAGQLVTEGHNAFGTITGCLLQRSPSLHGESPHDQVNTNPQLADLLDNGDAGFAHYPLLTGSPLIDAGGPLGRQCTHRDQIGSPRVNAEQEHGHAVLCDVGAIEFVPPNR
jgi:hypothetical protein